jgi:nucleoside-diphosphate-sugar epimerase
MILPTSESELDKLLTQPNAADLAFAEGLEGDVIVLGAGGKMGPTLARRLHKALRDTGRRNKVLAVSRFQSPGAVAELRDGGVETISCDLLDPPQVQSLPFVPNVLFLAGRKFGSAGDPELTWAMNTMVPTLVAQHYRDARIVAFSTGNVYPFVTPERGGSVETDAPEARGEYAQSCLGRERMFEYYSKQFQTPCLLYRLNYAVDLRYGVLVDIARQVYAGTPVDLSVPAFNVLWQGDANSYAIRSLSLCMSPARIMNVTGPETLHVQRVAEYFGARFQRELHFERESSGVALLNNAGACHAALGYPEVTADQLMEAVATWVEAGGSTLNKATKFQVTDGKF